MAMTETERLAKNQRIKERGKATRARRSKLDCRTYHLKLSPNKPLKNKLERLFLEAKWLRNAATAANNFQVNFLNELTEGCPVKTPSGIEQRSLSTLGSQMKQGVLTQCRSDLKTLAAAKSKGRKVGRLRFAKEVNSINLQQHGTTYELSWDRKQARIQNIGWVKVYGLKQLDGYEEIANAKLLAKPDGYYLAVTAYFEKGSKNIPIELVGNVGIDMGVATHVTVSNGEKLNSMVSETEPLKRLQRKLSRQVKGSNNYAKTVNRIRREYQKMDRRKDDFANKLVRDLLRNEVVFFQDENLSAWRSRKMMSKMGRGLQHSALGRIKAKLVASDRAVMLDRWVATSQYCHLCGNKTKHSLSERVFACASCGFTQDRDVHAALNMITLGLIALENSSGAEESACGGTVRPGVAAATPGKSQRSRKRRSL